jgi:type II secretory pathway component PulK
VFVLALVVVAAITAIMAMMAADQMTHVRQTTNRLEINRAERMAESGVRRAIAELALIEQQNVTNQTATWYTLGNIGADRFLVGDDSFRLEIIDASSRISLNTATLEQLTALGLTTEQIDSLLDWREAGTTPRTEGAKDEFYNNLENPYNARRRRFESVDELLLVKGFLPQTIYSPLEEVGTPTITFSRTGMNLAELCTTSSFSLNLQANGQNRQNINTATIQTLTQAGLTPPVATAIIARRGGGFAGMGAVLQTPGLDNRQAGILVDQFSVGAGARVEGRINVNTAPQEVLETITGITPDIASSLISRQASGINAMSELLQIPGFSVNVLQQTVDRLTVASDTFLVRVIGQAGSARVARTYAVRVENGQPRIEQTMEPPQSDMRTQWGWEQDATSDVTLTEAAR